MQLLILALFLVLYLHDGMPSLVSDGQGWVLWLWLVGSKLLLAVLYAAACRKALRRLASREAARHLRRIERFGGVYRVGVFVLFVADLYLGLLIQVRDWIEAATGMAHTVLVDELLVMLPTLGMWGVGWCVFYPIERRLREAALLRNLDQGRPVYPVWSRWQFVLSQYRYQVALILLPLLGVIAWTEVVEWMVRRDWAWVPAGTEAVWTVGGCLIVFLFAPVIIRLAWDTVPLPEGEIREHLLAMCRTHRVRIRELLLWRTYGGMINAAVMGLIGPLRYILITDGLLQQMPMPHVEAVMAHELAHIRKRHMIWLLLTAVALMSVVEVSAVVFLVSSGVDLEAVERSLSTVAEDAGSVVLAGSGLASLNETHLLLLGTLVGAAAAWVVGFGWVSRRIERQADSFAAAHLARERGGDIIQSGDAQTMIDALQHVAELNHIRTEKHSWRHGSIKWRQDYLRRLVGQPVGRLPIDRQMRWVNVLALVVVAASVLLHIWAG
jgi:STE24 endopeptidase